MYILSLSDMEGILELLKDVLLHRDYVLVDSSRTILFFKVVMQNIQP
jgi:hypothetical protein